MSLALKARQKARRKGGAKERVFGCDLLEHLQQSGQDVPQVLRSCTEFVEQHGVVDGIYRLSGVSSNIQRLRQEFDSDRCPDLHRDVYLQDIHCVSSLCKAYFRELPNPLLTYQLYDKFADAVAIQMEEARLVKIKEVLKELPAPHYRTLEFLMRHLLHMASYSSQTNMHARNLAIVWAPNLLRSKDIEATGFNGTAAFMEVRVQSIVVEFILTHVEQLFGDAPLCGTRRGGAALPAAPRGRAGPLPRTGRAQPGRRAPPDPALPHHHRAQRAQEEGLPQGQEVEIHLQPGPLQPRGQAQTGEGGGERGQVREAELAAGQEHGLAQLRALQQRGGPPAQHRALGEAAAAAQGELRHLPLAGAGGALPRAGGEPRGEAEGAGGAAGPRVGGREQHQVGAHHPQTGPGGAGGGWRGPLARGHPQPCREVRGGAHFRPLLRHRPLPHHLQPVPPDAGAAVPGAGPAGLRQPPAARPPQRRGARGTRKPRGGGEGGGGDAAVAGAARLLRLPGQPGDVAGARRGRGPGGAGPAGGQRPRGRRRVPGPRGGHGERLHEPGGAPRGAAGQLPLHRGVHGRGAVLHGAQRLRRRGRRGGHRLGRHVPQRPRRAQPAGGRARAPRRAGGGHGHGAGATSTAQPPGAAGQVPIAGGAVP